MSIVILVLKKRNIHMYVYGIWWRFTPKENSSYQYHSIKKIDVCEKSYISYNYYFRFYQKNDFLVVFLFGNFSFIWNDFLLVKKDYIS